MLVTDIPVTRPAPGVAVIHVPAELDVYTVPGIRQLHIDLVQDGVYTQIFDLTAVEFIDSTGLGVLVGAKKRLAAHGGTIVLDSPNPPVRHVLDRVTGLTKVFHVVENLTAGSEA